MNRSVPYLQVPLAVLPLGYSGHFEYSRPESSTGLRLYLPSKILVISYLLSPFCASRLPLASALAPLHRCGHRTETERFGYITDMVGSSRARVISWRGDPAVDVCRPTFVWRRAQGTWSLERNLGTGSCLR